jgi:hypothetical protein
VRRRVDHTQILRICNSRHLCYRDLCVPVVCLLNLPQLMSKQYQATNFENRNANCSIEGVVLHDCPSVLTLIWQSPESTTVHTSLVHITVKDIFAVVSSGCAHDHDHKVSFGASLTSCDLKYDTAAIHTTIAARDVKNTVQVCRWDSRSRRT